MDDAKPPARPQVASPRRVFTAPCLTTAQKPSSSSDSASGLVETLFSHPSVKIVSFTAGPRVLFSPGKGAAAPPTVEPGTLSWSSQLERTIATGYFRIYRAPGSVAFLSCGSALQPILPKSQCWCVDETSSRYVLQIRRPQYWRIEVPVASDDDARRAVLLRETLDKILQFEKTECPFKRTFTVELPQATESPVKKRPWTPVRKSFVPVSPWVANGVETNPFLNRATSGGVTKAITLESTPNTLGTAIQDGTPTSTSDAAFEESEAQAAETDIHAVGNNVTGRVEEPAIFDEPDSSLSSQTKPRGFQTNRSVTAPPHLTLLRSDSASSERAELHSECSDSHSSTESQDSFHSVDSWTSPLTPLPPSPPISHNGSPNSFTSSRDNAKWLKRSSHHRDVSDATITPITPQTWTGDGEDVAQRDDDRSATGDTMCEVDDLSSKSSVSIDDKFISSPPSPTPEAEEVNIQPVPATTVAPISTALPQNHYIRHRSIRGSISISTPDRRSVLSPPLSAADLFTPPQHQRSSSSQSRPIAKPSHNTSRSLTSSSSSSASITSNGANAKGKLDLIRRLPMAVVLKTVEVLLAPPAHLVNLMLRIAAMIAAGEWRGVVFGSTDDGTSRVNVSWGEWSDEDDDGAGELGGWGADEDWAFDAVGKTPSTKPARMVGSFPETPDADRREWHVLDEAHEPRTARQRGKHPEQEDEERRLEVEAGDQETSAIAGGWSRSWEVD